MIRGLLLILATVFAASANAQDTCPIVTVRGPAGVPRPGDLITFTAKVDTKSSTYKPIFRWTISTGDIISGQGTASLSVRPPTSGLSLTVTVDLLGLPDGCEAAASETMSGPHRVEPSKIGMVRGHDGLHSAVVREFTAQLKENPNNQGYIIAGHAAGTTSAQISAREKAIRDAVRKADPDNFDDSRIRITAVERSADVMEFWRVPPGADNPSCESCKPQKQELPEIGDLVMHDEFGKLPIKDELGRLDLAAAEWRNNPSSFIYLYLSRDPIDSLASEQTRSKRIRNHLTGKRKVPANRVVILKGDMDHRSTQIYMVPADARRNMPAGQPLDSNEN